MTFELHVYFVLFWFHPYSIELFLKWYVFDKFDKFMFAQHLINCLAGVNKMTNIVFLILYVLVVPNQVISIINVFGVLMRKDGSVQIAYLPKAACVSQATVIEINGNRKLFCGYYRFSHLVQILIWADRSWGRL